MALQRLPRELLLNIAEYLIPVDSQDLASLARTCYSVHDSAIAVLYRHVRLREGKNTPDQRAQRIRSLLRTYETHPERTEILQCLEVGIGSYGPRNDLENSSIDLLISRCHNFHDTGGSPGLADTDHTPTFPNLKKLHLEWSHLRAKELLGLISNPKLRDLTVRYFESDFAPACASEKGGCPSHARSRLCFLKPCSVDIRLLQEILRKRPRLTGLSLYLAPSRRLQTEPWTRPTTSAVQELLQCTRATLKDLALMPHVTRGGLRGFVTPKSELLQLQAFEQLTNVDVPATWILEDDDLSSSFRDLVLRLPSTIEQLCLRMPTAGFLRVENATDLADALIPLITFKDTHFPRLHAITMKEHSQGAAATIAAVLLSGHYLATYKQQLWNMASTCRSGWFTRARSPFNSLTLVLDTNLNGNAW